MNDALRFQSMPFGKDFYSTTVCVIMSAADVLAAATPRLKTKGWALGKDALLAASEVIFVLALHRYVVQREGIFWSRSSAASDAMQIACAVARSYL